MKLVRVLCLVFVWTNVLSAPNVPLHYLSQFGYLPKNPDNSSKLLDASTYQEAIKAFQDFAGLDVTGEVDDKTLETMALPRCGVKDKLHSGARAKRYSLQGSRWKVKNLTYQISKYPKNLKQSQVDNEVQKAFNVWSEYTDLTFRPGKGQVHIDIRFERGEHGDGDPFDGPGGTLAHAYFPVYGGDAHFDADERWSVDSYSGTNLFQVAAHEFGHSLGLSHSDVRSALMAPFYRGYDPIFSLDQDDIQGIQTLYGKKSKKRPAQPTPSYPTDEDYDESKTNDRRQPAPGASNPLCHDSKIDTIFVSPEGSTYVFKKQQYWKLTDKEVAPGYPKNISIGWPGLPGNLDAAFSYKNGKTYFFKGSKYWRYKGRKMDGLYPKEISDGFTGIPDDLDAAMVWSGNGKIYFYKGTKFWRFDPASRPPVKSTYPKLISNWEGVPNNLDTAFQWTNGYTYFFKNNGYYRFNDRMFAVDTDDVAAFPRATAYWWFGCKEAPQGTIQIATSEFGGARLLDGGSRNDSEPFNPETGKWNLTSNSDEIDGPARKSTGSRTTASLVLLTLTLRLTHQLFKVY